MGKLEELREKLYKKNEAIQERVNSVRREPSRESARQLPKSGWTPEEPVGPGLTERVIMAQSVSRRPRIYFLVFGAVLLFAASAIVYLLFYQSGRVDLEVVGPAEVEVGAVATIIVSIGNDEAARLEHGSLYVTYGPGVVAADSAGLGFGQERRKMSVEDILPGQELRTELRVRAFGRSQERRVVSVSYLYRPQNIASELVRKSEFSFLISRVPASVSLSAPEIVDAGETVEINVDVDSESSVVLEAVALRLDFPSGFDVAFTDPAPSEGQSIFLLGDLGPGASKKIVLKGRVSGEAEEIKTFRAILGRWNQNSQEWLEFTDAAFSLRIASPLISVMTSLNGRRDGWVSFGDQLNGQVIYRNNTDEKLENIEITLLLPERLIDLETLSASGGFYDATRSLLVFNSVSSAGLRELSPGQEGRLDFSVRLKTTPPIKTFADKNFVLPVLTTISSLSRQPQFRGLDLAYEDRITLKLASRLALSAKVIFHGSSFSNSGPLPPKIGQETTYVVIWQLANSSNDLADAEVRGSVGGGVRWRGVSEATAGTVAFNESLGEVVWRIPNLKASTGILRPGAKASFQIAIIPAENQIGTSPLLLQLISASGRDMFTGKDIEVQARDLTTELSGDPGSSFGEWRVVR